MLKLARFRGDFPLGGERSTNGQKASSVLPAGLSEKDRRTRANGRGLDDLASEFELARQTVRNWVKQGDLDAGRRSDGLTSAEHEEVMRLRKRVPLMLTVALCTTSIPA